MSEIPSRLASALADRYTLLRELGSGGMATVYLARDLKHERNVAIKELRSEVVSAVGAVRFLREIRLTAGLQHPHILPLHDSGEVEGTPFYVMPFVEGESLRQRLARGGELPLPEAVRILREIADALRAAHDRGIVHRDVKPDNVLLSEGHALVSDFGVAKALSDAVGSRDLTSSGVVIGTPVYMSPEQAMADPIDHRADIYAFGVMAYEVLTGRPPFEGSTTQAVLAAHLTQTPPPLTRTRPSVSAELEALVAKCLEKRPADRWQSAAELVARLDRITTQASGTTAAAGAPGRRGTSVVVAAVIGALALGGFALAKLWPLPEPGLDPTRIVVVPFEDQTGDASLSSVGTYAADWIPRELQRTLGGVLQVVPSTNVRDAIRNSDADSVPGATELARLVAAGTAISGWVRLSGDRIQVGGQLFDVNSGTLIQSVEPASAPRDSVEALVTRLAERVALAAGGQFSPRFRWWQGRAPPPSLAAFREVEAGLEEFGRGRYREALSHFDSAHELDSTYIEPMMHAWASHYNLGGGTWVTRRDTLQMLEMQQAESLLVTLAQHETLFSPADRAEFMWKSGIMFGDLEAEYRGAEASFEVSPGTGYAVGLSAIKTHRPSRAIEAMSSVDPAGTWEERWSPYWGVLARAYHQAGQLREALEVIEGGRRAVPRPEDLLRVEVVVRAALGQTSEVNELLDLAFTMPNGQVAIAATAADEYRAHGHADLAGAPLEQALHWLEARPPDERQTPAHRFDLATVFYEMGRWNDALRLFAGLPSETPADPARLGYLGATLARLGRRTEALAVSERLRDLDTPYLYGAHTLWRSRIRAVLGDSADAVALLRQAYEEGRPYPSHATPEFQGLEAYGPYVELMRVRELLQGGRG